MIFGSREKTIRVRVPDGMYMRWAYEDARFLDEDNLRGDSLYGYRPYRVILDGTNRRFLDWNGPLDLPEGSERTIPVVCKSRDARRVRRFLEWRFQILEGMADFSCCRYERRIPGEICAEV